MDIINPLILGIVTKVYDDIVDINLNVSNNVVETLKSLIILFFTFTAQNDFFFSFPCMIVCMLNSGFDNPFWKSLLPVSAIITIYNLFGYTKNNLILKIIVALVVLSCILLIASFEEKLFPEEVSIEKIVFRILLICIFLVIAVLLYFDRIAILKFGARPLLKTTLIMLSNMVVSVGTMTYLLYFSGKSLKELNGL
jgi:hypothetical protein